MGDGDLQADASAFREEIQNDSIVTQILNLQDNRIHF
jgi:hypothetical protein